MTLKNGLSSITFPPPRGRPSSKWLVPWIVWILHLQTLINNIDSCCCLTRRVFYIDGHFCLIHNKHSFHFALKRKRQTKKIWPSPHITLVPRLGAPSQRPPPTPTHTAGLSESSSLILIWWVVVWIWTGSWPSVWQTAEVGGNMNQIHGKLIAPPGFLEVTGSPSPCQAPSTYGSVNMCALAHTDAQAARGTPSILISIPSQRADATPSVCQTHKLAPRLSLLPHHYDITPVSHSDDIMPSGSCSCLSLPSPFFSFWLHYTRLLHAKTPSRRRSQGRRPDCESGSSLVSNYWSSTEMKAPHSSFCPDRRALFHTPMPTCCHWSCHPVEICQNLHFMNSGSVCLVTNNEVTHTLHLFKSLYKYLLMQTIT